MISLLARRPYPAPRPLLRTPGPVRLGPLAGLVPAAVPERPAARGLCLWAALGACAVLTGTGCADDTDQLTKELGQMQAEIRDLRGSSLATQDRIEALERDLGALEQARKAEQARVETDRPMLPVIRLSPPGDDAAPVELAPAVPDAAAAPSLEPRPVLRGDRFGTTLDPKGAATEGTAPGIAGARPASKGAGARPAARPGTGPRTTNEAK